MPSAKAHLTRARLLAVLFSALSSLAWGDDLGVWLDTDARANVYSVVAAELRALFAEGDERHVPVGLLMERLREGASKGVDPEILVRALREELDRLERSQLILAGASGAGAERNVKEVSLLLRAGLPDALIHIVLNAASRAGRDTETALAACSALADLRRLGSIGDEESARIGELLLRSRVSPRRYASLASVFTRAKTRGMSDGDIVQTVIIRSLESGGGLSAMDREIDRSGPGRPGRGERPSSPGSPGRAGDAPRGPGASQKPGRR